jgi:serine/threonine protein kinase, bacterial
MLLNNRYRVITTLGSGGFGETFLVEDTQMPSHRRCVVKLLKPITTNPQIYELVKTRFQREAAILEELGGNSDQIPNLHGYFQENGQFYLVQEWIEGATLTAKVRQQGLFSECTVQKLLINLLPVLEYVHSQRILHRDIKPDNIMVRHRDEKPVLIDFGAVRESMGTVINSQGNSTSSIIIGTPGYMPPEQAAGRPVYSSDLFSLGITAIYLLTLKQPQELETDSKTGEIIWHQYVVGISSQLISVIDKAIAYHPRDRFSTAKEMLDALLSINTLPPTQQVITPFITQTQQTIPAASKPVDSANRSNALILSTLIAASLIGISAIIGIAMTKTLQFAQPIDAGKPTISPFSNPTDYSWLSQRPVTDADLNNKDGLELDIMRNSIYARRGRQFTTTLLQQHFDAQSWYRPLYPADEFDRLNNNCQLLLPIECKNVMYIKNYQDFHNRKYFK